MQNLNKQPHRVSKAFTLVELLVVIAIIGILVALLLPAVQAAREAARRAQCTSHLKNLTLGMINHESSAGTWPASGWPGVWSADPDRGTGAKQPGSWLFAILPFIEEQALHDMGSGKIGQERVQLLVQRDTTRLAIANCPTRRSGGPYPSPHLGEAITGDGQGGAMKYKYTEGARSDYAVNVGDEIDYDRSGSSRCRSISPENYVRETFPVGFPPTLKQFSGVSFCGNAVKSKAVTDGLSNTIALGEKWIPIDRYETGAYLGDDWSQFIGFQDDMVRSTFYDNVTPDHVPRQDGDPGTLKSAVLREIFGSAHSSVCLFSMCDGSVTAVPFDVDAEVFRRMGHRADGGVKK